MAFLSYRRGTLAFALAVLTGCASSPMRDMQPPMAPSGPEQAPADMAEPAAEAPTSASVDAMQPVAAGAPGAGRSTSSLPRMPAPPKESGAPAAKGTPPTAPRGAKEPASAKNPAAPGVEQMIIFTGGLDLEVDEGEFGGKLHDAVDLAVEHGGYIGKQTDSSVTLRVPSSHFRTVMRELEKLGDVLHRSVNAQDVSEKYFDLKVRLKSLLATRDRLQKFLDRAKTIDEVLRVEQELTRLNTQIDQVQGRMRYLSAQSAYSTITLSLRARPEPPKKIVKRDEKKVKKPPPPPPRTISMPIPWLSDVSLDGLLSLGRK